MVCKIHLLHGQFLSNNLNASLNRLEVPINFDHVVWREIEGKWEFPLGSPPILDHASFGTNAVMQILPTIHIALDYSLLKQILAQNEQVNKGELNSLINCPVESSQTGWGNMVATIIAMQNPSMARGAHGGRQADPHSPAGHHAVALMEAVPMQNPTSQTIIEIGYEETRWIEGTRWTNEAVFLVTMIIVATSCMCYEARFQPRLKCIGFLIFLLCLVCVSLSWSHIIATPYGGVTVALPLLVNLALTKGLQLPIGIAFDTIKKRPAQVRMQGNEGVVGRRAHARRYRVVAASYVS